MTKEEAIKDMTQMFQAAVKESYQDLIDKAVAAEREACAKLLEDAAFKGTIISCTSAAAAIRARGAAMNTQPEALRLAELLETDGWPDAAAELRRLHEENEALRKPSGYAGVTIWIGNKRITQTVTEPQIKYEREAGFLITAAAQYCLDALAKAKEQT
jgi:hypothetical protein